MPPSIATLIFVTGIIGLFVLDRDKDARASAALWIPTIWLWIACSRAASQWLQTLGLMGGAWAIQTTSSEQYLSGSPFDAVFFATLIAAGIFVLLGRRRRTAQFLQANAPILLFCFFCLLSVAWSDYSGVAIKRWIKFAGSLVMVLVVLTDTDPQNAFKRLLKRASFTLVPLSILFIKYYPDWGRSLDPRPGNWILMYCGVTTNKNEMGLICLIFGLFSVWLVLHKYNGASGWDRRRHMVAHGAILLMVFWLLWEVDSATSLSCFLMGTVLIAGTSMFRLFRQRRTINVVVLSMLSVSMFALFVDTGGNLVGALGRNSTLTGRTGLWDVILTMRGNLILGTGFESFWLGPRIAALWQMFWWHPTESHNGYLEIFLNLGLVGVAIFALVIVTGYRNALSAFRDDPENNSIKVAYLVAALAYNLTEAAIVGTNPIWFLFLMATVATPVTKPAEARSRLPVRTGDALAPWTAKRRYQLPSTAVEGAGVAVRRVSRRPA